MATRRVTVDEALRSAAALLSGERIEAPRLQASLLLGHVLGLDRAGLLARLSEPLDAEAEAHFRQLVGERARHRPLQYLLGRAPFLDFEVDVREGVFIPRPETEQLVQRTLQEWPAEAPWALDLCTGSGVVAIGLARARPAGRVLAIDVSEEALDLARQNAERVGVLDRVAFLRSDLLSGLTESPWEQLGTIACNPPYVPHADVTQPEVRDHEPELAWSGGATGLNVYRQLLPQAARLLPPGRSLLLEIGDLQEPALRELLRQDGSWGAPRFDLDFQGIARVLQAPRR